MMIIMNINNQYNIGITMIIMNINNEYNIYYYPDKMP
jgi:hypothetical protein